MTRSVDARRGGLTVNRTEWSTVRRPVQRQGGGRGFGRGGGAGWRFEQLFEQSLNGRCQRFEGLKSAGSNTLTG